MHKQGKRCYILVDVTAVIFILSSTAQFTPKSYAIAESVDIFREERQIRRS